MEPVKIRIRGHEYVVRGGENEGDVHRVAEYVNDKMEEIQESAEGLSEKKTAILAALNIASEYFQLLREREELLAKIRRRTESLIGNIDSIVGNPS